MWVYPKKPKTPNLVSHKIPLNPHLRMKFPILHGTTLSYTYTNHNHKQWNPSREQIRYAHDPNTKRGGKREKEYLVGAESELGLMRKAESDLGVRTVEMAVAERQMSRGFRSIVSLHGRRSWSCGSCSKRRRHYYSSRNYKSNPPKKKKKNLQDYNKNCCWRLFSLLLSKRIVLIWLGQSGKCVSVCFIERGSDGKGGCLGVWGVGGSATDEETNDSVDENKETMPSVCVSLETMSF